MPQSKASRAIKMQKIDSESRSPWSRATTTASDLQFSSPCWSVSKSAASALNSQVLVDQFANQPLLQSDLKPGMLNFWVSRKYVQICLNRNETSQRLKLKVFNQSKVMNPASFFLSWCHSGFLFSGVEWFLCVCQSSLFCYIFRGIWLFVNLMYYVFFEANGNNLFFFLVAFLFHFVRGRLG
jgi:hypothetical protein